MQNIKRTALEWRPSTEPDEFGEYILTARAPGGYRFRILPGSFMTLIAERRGERLFVRTANEPGPLKAAATRYVKSVTA
jgi:hypothetical protein